MNVPYICIFNVSTNYLETNSEIAICKLIPKQNIFITISVHMHTVLEKQCWILTIQLAVRTYEPLL